MRLRSLTVLALPVLFLCFFATVPAESPPEPETSPPGSPETSSKPLVREAKAGEIGRGLGVGEREEVDGWEEVYGTVFEGVEENEGLGRDRV
ncbi:hypothetical protein ACFX19_043806 [Malus domestica]